MIRNKEKKYATFNIRQAILEHCVEDSIVVLVDGDDELVGRYVFSLLNAAYQSSNYWIVYTNYFMSDFKYGGSKYLPKDYF